MRRIVLWLGLAALISVVVLAVNNSREVDDAAALQTIQGFGGDPETTYVDPLDRFEFRYPTRFGQAKKYMESFHGDRPVSLHFTVPPSRLLDSNEPTGLVAFTTGRVTVEHGAFGMLYDAELARQLFGEAEWKGILEALPELTTSNVCEVLASERHLRLNSPSLVGFSSGHLEVARNMDVFGHHDPQVLLCQRDSSLVLFHETLREEPRSPRLHVFGCIRFLDGDYSSVQYVQKAFEAPSASHLAAIREMIRSVKFRDAPNLKSTIALLETAYEDSLGRFSFRYPKRLGDVIAGPRAPDDGRTVSLRFTASPKKRWESPTNRFVITKGRVTVEHGACGLLYDPNTSRDLFSKAEWEGILTALPPLTAKTFCDAISNESHLNSRSPSLKALTPSRLEVARLVDNNGHHDPQVILCQVDSNIVLFHERLSTQGSSTGGSMWNVFGCIRFLDGEYSSVQYVDQSIDAPSAEHLASIREMIRSVEIPKSSTAPRRTTAAGTR